MKALLLLKKGDFSIVHNIKRLKEELEDDLGLSDEIWELAYELTQCYFISRYPDLVEGPPDEVVGRGTAERSLRACEAIVRRAAEVVEKAIGRDKEGS